MADCSAFADFGKSINDLFTKKFSKGGFELNSKRIASDVTVESVVSVTPSKKDGSAIPNSSFKLGYRYPRTGDYDIDVNVNGKAKATATFDKLAPNLALKVGLQTAENDVDILDNTRAPEAVVTGKFVQRPFVTVQADYALKAAHVSATVNANGNGAFVDVGASAAYDQLSFGAGAKLALAKVDPVTGLDAALVQDYKLGARYAGPNYIVGLMALTKAKRFSLSHIQTVDKDYTVGSQFDFSPSEPGNGTLTLGSSYKPASDTLVKVKAGVGKEALTVTGFYEKSFLNPRVKVGATAEVNALQNVLKPTWYGVSVSVGDY